ncbi:MAG: Ppx/GppA phosphatase family protein [Proteobacteria bacterium]|nr:Ppx/GppA phosphatase family protein [Pseudomonadota bacterium]
MPKGSNNTRAKTAASTAQTRPPCYAAIDLGTNNCRMLVARAEGDSGGDGLHVIDGFSRIVRLGEGLAASGRLSDDAIERTIKALKICGGKIRDRGVVETRAIATEACRQAANGDEFLGRVEAETGLTMKIISAVDEAELTLAGCAPLLNTDHPKALLFDIGGGSTELMWIDTPSGGPPKALDILSLPIGVVGLAEEFGQDALAPETFEIIVERVAGALAPFEDRHQITEDIDAGRVHMLGTSGTVTTLGAIYLDLARYDRARVDGLSIRMESIDAICANLMGLDFDSRHNHPCIGPGRADLMVMGCAVITAICRRWPASHLTAADRGIREGLLLDMIAATAVEPIGAP